MHRGARRLAGNRHRRQALLRFAASPARHGHRPRRSGCAGDPHREVRHDVSARAALRRRIRRRIAERSWWSKKSAASWSCSFARFSTICRSRPMIVGKQDERGERLLRAEAELDPEDIVKALGRHTRRSSPARQSSGVCGSSPRSKAAAKRRQRARIANFCSGCPHNRSTVLLEGQVAGGGIGCHAMAAQLAHSDRGYAFLTHMGGEGAPWIGMSPFVERQHIFQNIGDGTYFHSGQLALERVRRRRRQHHLQDSLQRHGRDDRRPGRRRRATDSRSHAEARSRRRQEDGRPHRRSGKVYRTGVHLAGERRTARTATICPLSCGRWKKSPA